MATFQDALNKKYDQMTEIDQKNVRTAIKEGQEVIQLGRYYVGGPLMISVQVKEDSKNFPPLWFAGFHNTKRVLEAKVNPECEEKTIEWVKKKYPQAVIALG